jgi:hypothetical protein
MQIEGVLGRHAEFSSDPNFPTVVPFYSRDGAIRFPKLTSVIVIRAQIRGRLRCRRRALYNSSCRTP